MHSVSHRQSKGIDLLYECNRSVGDGNSFRFWEETWCRDGPLKVLFPCVYALDGNKLCMVAQRINNVDWSNVLRRLPRGGVESNQYADMMEAIHDVVLSDSKDGWKWALNSYGFSVASTRKHIDEHILIGSLTPTRWPRCIPIIVNVFMWKLRLDKLPTLVNMDRKGIEVASLLCPVCNKHVESVDHLFFLCGMTRDIWGLLARWCDLDILKVYNIAEWFRWLDVAHVSKNDRLILERVATMMMWSIWNFRNALIFFVSKPKKANI
ncbi:RNA-directed DNA polymerase, eukaryota, reverse transcriptase zinc-binding domain protein [Tanacetum coccineum]